MTQAIQEPNLIFHLIPLLVDFVNCWPWAGEVEHCWMFWDPWVTAVSQTSPATQICHESSQTHSHTTTTETKSINTPNLMWAHLVFLSSILYNSSPDSCFFIQLTANHPQGNESAHSYYQLYSSLCPYIHWWLILFTRVTGPKGLFVDIQMASL